MKFFQEEYIKNFPDCYNKQPTSNNYKIMQLLKHDEENFRSVLQDLTDGRSLDTARGHALNLYGEMYGQARGNMTDEQYRIAIKQKMAIYMCKSDMNSILNVLSYVVGVPASAFHLKDGETGGSIDVQEFPYDNLQNAGFTVAEAWNMLQSLLPAGVKPSGFNLSHEASVPVNVASTVTHSESYVVKGECLFYENIEAEQVNAASAVTHNENHIMEVLD